MCSCLPKPAKIGCGLPVRRRINNHNGQPFFGKVQASAHQKVSRSPTKTAILSYLQAAVAASQEDNRGLRIVRLQIQESLRDSGPCRHINNTKRDVPAGNLTRAKTHKRDEHG